MSRSVHIELEGGGRECFINHRCPVYAMFLLNLQNAPYSNVFHQRLRKLQGRFPDLIKKSERHNNATLVCKGINCPVYPQPKFPSPIVRVLHLKPENSTQSDRHSY